MAEQGEQGNALVELLVWVVGLASVGLLLAIAFSGCAFYKVDPATGEGRSYGFLRNLTVSETVTVAPDGTRTEARTVTTTSTTGDVLLGANELLGTMVNAAEKVKP